LRAAGRVELGSAFGTALALKAVQEIVAAAAMRVGADPPPAAEIEQYAGQQRRNQIDQKPKPIRW